MNHNTCVAYARYFKSEAGAQTVSEKQPGRRWTRWTRWTIEEEELVRELQANKHPIDSIATALSRSPGGIRSRLSRLEHGKASNAISKGELDLPTQARARAPSPTHTLFQRWTKADNEQLMHLHSQKLSTPAIAARLNRSYKSIANRLTLLRQGSLPTPVSQESAVGLDDERTIRSLKAAKWTWGKIHRERLPHLPATSVRQAYFDSQQRAVTSKLPWSEACLYDMVEMRQMKVPWKQIASKLNRTEKSCMVKFYSHMAGKRPPRSCKRWSTAEDKILMAMRAEGVPFAAAVPGRSRRSASHRWHRLSGDEQVKPEKVSTEMAEITSPGL